MCAAVDEEEEEERGYGCLAEELSDARVMSKAQVISAIETLTLDFLSAISNGKDPELSLANRSEKNVVRDGRGSIHLGRGRTVKKLFAKNCSGAERYAKIWQVLALIQRLLLEGKVATQREAYYCLVQHFKTQAEFNDTLQDVVALTGCARASLGICASSSGAVAGCLLWKDEGGEPIDCSTTVGGKRIPGVIDGVTFQSLGARYILVVEKDAVFTYLCGQRIWNTLPCIVATGCGYPPLSVRAVVKQLAQQLKLPVLGLFDYNPHGVRIMLTYKFGSTRMGLEAHAYAVDMKWLGVHHDDILGESRVAESALQPWVASDERVYGGLVGRVREGLAAGEQPGYLREVRLMAECRVKAEIEALNSSTSFDSLEQKIIKKILRREYF